MKGRPFTAITGRRAQQLGSQSPRAILAKLTHAARASKYHAQPIRVNGIWFASHREARRWCDLQKLENAGLITGLVRQPTYCLHVNGIAIGKYRPDFLYYSTEGLVVEDAKGVRTPLYNWKKKHVEAEYGITVTEV